MTLDMRILACAVFQIMFLLLLQHSMTQNPNSVDPAKVFVQIDKVIAEVDDRFLSVALDTGLVVKHWESIDFSSERYNALAKALSPAYLRLGGNAADFLIFQNEGVGDSRVLHSELYSENYDGRLGHKNLSEFNMSAQDFDLVNKFAVRNGMRLLFDFNVLTLRDAADQWNASNARDILAYAIKKGYDSNLIFSLGNEPNSFPHAFHRTVTAEQLGKDFITLYETLRNDPKLSPHFRNSLLVGPDITQPKVSSLKYLNGFLDVAGSKINAVSFHQYYIDGRTATVDDMMSKDVLDILDNEFAHLRDMLIQGGFDNYPVWMSETGSCWGGGAKGLSDSYVAGFMWMDKIGQAAVQGVQVVIRQSFSGGHYALVSHDYDPNPDYWLTWLWKNLVGRKVFHVELEGSSDVRLYAHCSKTPRYVNGAVTLFGLNLADENVTLTFDGHLMGLKKHVYWLLPYGSQGLKSKTVQLSGKSQPLEMVDDTTFPKVEPVVIDAGKSVPVPGRSFGFVVFPDAQAKECF